MTFLTWIIVSSGCISMVLSLITFVALTMTERMKNFQGFVSRCYLASYSGCIIFLTTATGGSKLRNESLFIDFPICLIVGSFYFLSATMFWLNGMSINIWITCWKLRLSSNGKIVAREDPEIAWFLMYAWGSSLAHLLIIVSCVFVSSEDTLLVPYALLIPFTGIGIANINLLVSTSLMIQQHKSFIRYVGLFVMTTFNVTLMAVTVFTPTGLSLPPVSMILQIISTCVIFLKTDGRRWSLCNCFRRHSTTTVPQTDVETLS